MASDLTFQTVSAHPDRQAALHFWEKTGEYDFSHYQMYCDDALTKLGLYRENPHREDEDDSKYQYADLDGTFDGG